MKLRRICAAALVVAVGSTVTASAVAFQKTDLPASTAVSCPTASTGNAQSANNSGWLQSIVNDAFNSTAKTTASKAAGIATGTAKQNCDTTTAGSKTVESTQKTTSQNCDTTATKAATSKNCSTVAAVPDLSKVLNQVSCKQVNGTSTPSVANVTQSALPDCFQQLLKQCGIQLPDSLKNACQKPGSSSSESSSSASSKEPSSSESSSSSNAGSSSSQQESSAPSSSKPSSSAPESSTPSSNKPETSTPSSSKPADSLTFEEQVVQLVNQERAKAGLKPLTMNLKLSDVARAKSQDMRDNKYFSHTSPTYGSPFDMMKQFGISYRTAGENIAMGYRTPEAVMQGWMNSPGHKANILNSSFTEIGVGYVADGSYWTQQFIG